MEDVHRELIKQGHEVIPHYLPNGELNDWRKADVMVVWQETELGRWKEMILEWQKAGKRVFLLQHGRRGTSRIFPPFNETFTSDELCVWGENDVKRMVSCGVPREKIHVTSSPIFKHIKPRIPHEGINIAFSPEHWDIEVAENFAVRNALRKFVKSRWPWQKKVKIMTKILLGEHNPHDYDNAIPSDRHKPGHIDIAIEVLRRADAVVAVSESTFELLAEIMDIPVIIADIWTPKSCAGDERYKLYEREYSNACERVQDLNKLGEVVMKHIRNPQLLAKERKEIAILDGGVHIEDPVSEIIKLLTSENPRRANPKRGSRPHKRPHKG